MLPVKMSIWPQRKNVNDLFERISFENVEELRENDNFGRI
jgi:hypothetical protein